MLPALGIAIELAQIPIPGRGFEWADAMANTFGTFCGIFGASMIKGFAQSSK